MFINKTVLLFLFISSVTFSQTKKSVDTIFVYQKVIVYKTISKTDKKKQQSLGFDSLTRKKLSEVKIFNIHTAVDTLFLKMMVASLKKDYKKKDKKRFIIDNFGISLQSLNSQQSEIKSNGAGIGLFAIKNIYKNKLFMNFEFQFSKVFGSSTSKSLGGYYITPDAVLFYNPDNVSTQQINVPLTLSWKYKKIKPQIGIAYTNKQTEFDFLVYDNSTLAQPAAEKTSYKITNNYLDFVYGIEYEITKRTGVFLKSKQTLVKISYNSVAENLKPLEELHFFPNQLIFGVNYNLKK